MLNTTGQGFKCTCQPQYMSASCPNQYGLTEKPDINCFNCRDCVDAWAKRTKQPVFTIPVSSLNDPDFIIALRGHDRGFV